MIKQLTPVIRRRLVAARIAAMTEGADAAFKMLAETRASTCPLLDRVALGLLESEIYALDLRPAEARAAFENYVDPHLSEIDRGIAAVVADNKALILMSTFDQSASDEFYHLVDARRILGIELCDHSAILEAALGAAKGKHYEALPVYWQQLRAAYDLQNWRAYRSAEEDFAQDCARLGWLDEAAYHAMVATSNDAMDEVTKNLIAARSVGQITKGLDKILHASSLKGHAVLVARMVGTIADAIPDDRLGAVTEFLMRHLDHVPTGWHDTQLLEQMWHAIESLAPRLDRSSTSLPAARGLKHPVLQKATPSRRHVIGALNALTAALPPDDLRTMADTALRLINEDRNDIDYRESLNLLCHIAHCAPDDLKSRIRDEVFPPGVQISDTLLMQAGPHLGWKPQNPGGFAIGARETAKAIRKQVQRLGPGEEPAKIGGYGTFASTSPQGTVVVHVQGAMHWVEPLAQHRALIDAPSIEELIEAMLDMIGERENLIANRASLTSCIGKFADRISLELEHRVEGVLRKLAEGTILEPTSGQTHADAKNPLNPFKIGGGDPADLRGAALVCLAELDHTRPNIRSALHDGILLGAITSADPQIRRYGLAAAHECRTLTSMEASAVALAGLDADPGVARFALQALSNSQSEIPFEPMAWHIIIRSVEGAILSSHVGYRCGAANLLGRITDFPMELKPRIEAARFALQHDVCYSVREVMRNAMEAVER